MEISFDNYSLAPIQEKDAWRLCNFVVANEDYLKDYFPQTLQANSTPTLAALFVTKKERQFLANEEYLFTLKENENRTIVGLIYVKELFKAEGQGELAYCIGYPYYGKGITTEMVRHIIKWCFTKTALNLLQIIVHPSNEASKKIAKKCGFTFQRILPKEHEMANKEMADMLLYERSKDQEKATT